MSNRGATMSKLLPSQAMPLQARTNTGGWVGDTLMTPRYYELYDNYKTPFFNIPFRTYPWITLAQSLCGSSFTCT